MPSLRTPVLTHTKQRGGDIAAADSFGNYPYERLRARAMLLLLRYYGIRISDVATMRKDSVTGGEVTVRLSGMSCTPW